MAEEINITDPVSLDTNIDTNPGSLQNNFELPNPQTAYS